MISSPTLPRRRPSSCWTALLVGGLALLAGAAQAEKADRLKPLAITSERGGIYDIVKQRTEFNGDVIITKGTMLLRAETVDVRETSEGYHQAYASGQTGKQVNFRQARDVPGESIEGSADQLEYDARADTVRFLGNAVVRLKRGTVTTDEVIGAAIVFDNRSEVLTLEGGSASPHPSGRVRMVMMPRAASAPPADAPASAPTPLQPSPVLQQPRKPS